MSREFDSITSFLVHLAEVEVGIHAALHRGLDKALEVIEKDAKGRIGNYQDAVGPFPEWAELADSTEAEKERLGFPSGAPLERTGEMRDSIEREIVGLEGVVGSKDDIAEYQEFGTDRIPPRPFIGPAAFANKDKIQKILGHAIVEGLVGGEVIHEALEYDFEV
jgi:HK97 gp10 family phage protein